MKNEFYRGCKVVVRWIDKPRLEAQFGIVEKIETDCVQVRLLEAVDGFEAGKVLMFLFDEVRHAMDAFN